MDIIIRHEKKEDYRIVEEVAREAFWNLYFPGCSEHLVIHKMRGHEAYMPELSFVIEVAGEIVGSIFYTMSKIITLEGAEIPTITFGPMSILPSMHRKGLGRRLIEHTIALAKEMGHRAIVTLGYPYHYEVYGFKGGKAYGISMPDGNFYKGLLVLPLYERALDGLRGYVVFADVLDDQDSNEIDAFDRQFPAKEKALKASQREYDEASTMLDD